MTTADDAPVTMAEFRRRLDAGWAELTGLVKRLEPSQLDGPASADGWTVKDHLGHIAVWEASASALLQHRLHYTALGVPGPVFEVGGIDAVNAQIQARVRARDVDSVLADWREQHRIFLEALAPLGDADLVKVYHDYVPDAPWEEDGTPIVEWLVGNTFGHYAEHVPWIEEILAGVGSR